MSVVLWYKRDLRVKDHPALHKALRLANRQGVSLIPLYIVEPEQWLQEEHSARHWDFVRTSLLELQDDLKSLGSGLVVRQGNAKDALDELHKEHSITHLISHEEVGPHWSYERDKAVAAWCQKHAIAWTQGAHSPVVRGDIRKKDIKTGRNIFLQAGTLDRPEALPSLPPLHSSSLPTPSELGLLDPCASPQPAGRRAAVKAYSAFLLDHGDKYKAALSSPSKSWMHSSRVSPHLAYGTLSTREIYRGLSGRSQEHPPQDWLSSFKAFAARLYNRDVFMQQFEDNMWLEHTPATPAFENFKSEQPPSGALDAWKSGMTGYPFLDACMRSLTHTGWINFRMRAMMVSFASYHLWLPWRDIGVHMARMFTDYEPAIHWPLIQMQSGANLYNLPRIYNIAKQALDHDPDGVFTRQWCPELKDVPTALLQTPWEWHKAPSTLGGVYPKPFPGTIERGALSKDIAFQIHNSLNPQRRTGTPKPPPAQLSLDI